MKKVFFGAILIVSLLVMGGCATVSNEVADWNLGVKYYNTAQRDYAVCMQTQFNNNQKFSLLFSANAQYVAGNVAMSQKWAEGQNKSAELAALEQKYNEAKAAATNEQGTVDLGKLEAAGYTPEAIRSGLTIAVNSVVQAQAQVLDPSVTLALMDSINEGMNDNNAKCADYQTSVGVYNTWVGSVKQSVKVEVAHRLGIEYLPTQLSYYTPVAGALTPFVAPTTMFAPTVAP